MVQDEGKKMNIKFNPLEDFGPYVFAHKLSAYPYGAAKYAPRLHTKAYHEGRGKTINVHISENEVVNLQIPKNCKLADTKCFIADNEIELFHRMKTLLDNQFDFTPESITYESAVPFLGIELPIKLLPVGSEENGRIECDAVYLRVGFTEDEIRETVLELLSEKA